MRLTPDTRRGARSERVAARRGEHGTAREPFAPGRGQAARRLSRKVWTLARRGSSTLERPAEARDFDAEAIEICRKVRFHRSLPHPPGPGRLQLGHCPTERKLAFEHLDFSIDEFHVMIWIVRMTFVPGIQIRWLSGQLRASRLIRSPPVNAKWLRWWRAARATAGRSSLVAIHRDSGVTALDPGARETERCDRQLASSVSSTRAN